MMAECLPVLPECCLISLDHDLTRMPWVAQDPGTGLEVAELLARQQPVCPERWRKKADRGRRIPAGLWAGTVDLAGKHGVGQVSRASKRRWPSGDQPRSEHRSVPKPPPAPLQRNRYRPRVRWSTITTRSSRKPLSSTATRFGRSSAVTGSTEAKASDMAFTFQARSGALGRLLEELERAAEPASGPGCVHPVPALKSGRGGSDPAHSRSGRPPWVRLDH